MILVVAYNKNFAIAENGKIPWYVPEDFKHFKETTEGGVVIMGRVTYESLPDKFRPLPNRDNIIITRNPYNYMTTVSTPNGIHVTSSLEAAKTAAEILNDSDKIFVIGGSQIYNLALESESISKVIASEIDNDVTGDRFFPDLQKNGWKKSVVKEFENFRVAEFVLDAPK